MPPHRGSQLEVIYWEKQN